MIGSFRKLPSDSSASSIAHSPLPNFALLFKELITPPLIIVGSNFWSDRIFETSEVVVVFPWDPVMIIFFLSETTSANTSALEYIGIFLIRAYFNSLLLFLIAEDLTSIVAFFTFFLSGQWKL